MGFSGAYHGLLSAEELKKEMEWAVKNPWGEDMQTVFGRVPDALFPSSVDLVRPALRRLYSGHPPLLVADRDGESLYCGDADGFTAVPLIDATILDPRLLSKRLLRYYRREPYAAVVVVVDAVSLDAGRASAVFSALSSLAESKTSFEIAPIDSTLVQLTDEVSRVDADTIIPRMGSFPTDPISRIVRSSVVELKKGRRRGTDDLTKRRLERLTVLDIEESKGLVGEREIEKIEDRTLVADMSGEATLSESSLHAHFLHGKLTGLTENRQEILTGAASSSKMVRSGREWEFTTVGAFSFEDERSRGMRVVQGLGGPGVAAPGQIVSDFYFEEGNSALLISFTVSYPELHGEEYVDEYSLWELPLFNVRALETIGVEGIFPDGDRYSMGIEPTTESMILYGVDFRFNAGTKQFRIAFDSHPASPPEALPVRFRKSNTGYFFCINPRGSYARSPMASFVGIHEQFHLRISAGIAPDAAEAQTGQTNAVPLA
jgi:hypothetical protein